MRKWMNTGAVGALWLLSFASGTGLDSTYRITERVRIAMLVLTILVVLIKVLDKKKAPVKTRDLVAFGGMAGVFFLSALIHGCKAQPFEYLYAFLAVLWLSRLKFSEEDFRRIGLCVGIAGFTVLFIFGRATRLGGWNENSVAMIGFFSYLVFLIPLFDSRRRNAKLLILVTAVVVMFFLNMTESRSCLLFMLVTLAFALGVPDRKLLYRSNASTSIVLLFPLFAAIFVVLISSSQLIQDLDLWSVARYDKPFLNGRDVLWRNGFELLGRNPLLGCGDLNADNWHNSAVHALTAYGLLGYYLWLRSFHAILAKADAFLDDYLVRGCIVSFAIIYMQQSVELGIISTTPDLIPFIILGMMLGRVRYLREATYAEA